MSLQALSPSPRKVIWQWPVGQVSWLGDHPTDRAFPVIHQWRMRRSSPLTVAGQREIYTLFPLRPLTRDPTEVGNVLRKGEKIVKSVTVPTAERAAARFSFSLSVCSFTRLQSGGFAVGTGCARAEVLSRCA